jgi:acyl-coenzyme A thioesterase PaaI-like protein
VFLEAAKAAEDLVEKLRGQARRTRMVASSVAESIRIEGERYHYGDLMDFSPVCGLANPLAPPMTIMKGDDATMVGVVNFSSAYEGAPGLVHGGYIAAAFDEFLGVTQSLTGRAGVTGVLKVRYRNPCPVLTQLRIEGRVHRVDGRRITARSNMRNGGQVVADSEATFVIRDGQEI